MPVRTDVPAPEPGLLRRPWVLTLVVLLLSLGATLLAWNLARKGQSERDSRRLHRFVGRTEAGLQNRLGRYEDIARGAQGFFAHEPPLLSVGPWRDYVDRLDLPGRHPGLASLAFIARVPSPEMGAFPGARPREEGPHRSGAGDGVFHGRGLGLAGWLEGIHRWLHLGEDRVSAARARP